jgi:hypothetical protein
MKTPTLVAILIWFCISLPAHSQSLGGQKPDRKLVVTVVDETGVPVEAAQATLVRVETQAVFRAETDYAGRCEFAGLSPGHHQLRVEKTGFYAARLDILQVDETEDAEITLTHEQELRDEVNVVSSPPTIDPSRTAASHRLNSREIVNIPYSTTRDIRNLLPFIPGVVQDKTGQPHINGSATYQIQDQIDGFNITHPASGLLALRVSPDALRSIEVQGSRYSTEHGKGSGGLLSLTTGMGDDRLRFSATDFIPSFQSRKGVNINGWTPRMTLSGPLRKGRAWFFEAADADYNLDIVNELPKDADRNDALRFNNLAKAQVNLTPTNILAAGFVINHYRSGNAGLSEFTPLETTRELNRNAALFTLKDQHYFKGGLHLELGFAANRFRAEEKPLGDLPYVISLESRSGNFFRTSESEAERLQWLVNLTLPPVRWRGRHEFKLGADANRTAYEEFAERRMVSILRGDGTLSREVNYGNAPRSRVTNVELSAFAQDRWSITDRWLVEMGARLDRDRVVRRALVAPRLASTYLLTANSGTKLSAGVGVFYDATTLDLISRTLAGRRVDRFYAADGRALTRTPLETFFHVEEGSLRSPRFINTSLGLERKLPAAVYLRVELIARTGRDGFTYTDRDSEGMFILRNERRDRFHAVRVTVQRAFKDGYSVMVSYSRSAARSNAVFDFSLDNPIFSSMTDGRLPWDAPDRLISWGWLPFFKKFDLAYALDWRSGYPFSVVNQEQRVLGAPNSRRLPAYFSLNLHAERRVHLLGFQWALRAGFNNITNRRNASDVNNNTDSPKFLALTGIQGRAFVGRVRFLGRK